MSVFVTWVDSDQNFRVSSRATSKGGLPGTESLPPPNGIYEKVNPGPKIPKMISDQC